MSQKLRFWPKMAIFGLIWPNLAPKRIFSGKMTILSYKTIFGPTSIAFIENLLQAFFRNVPKTVILEKMVIFWHVRPNLGKMRIFLNKGFCYLFTLIVPQLHAKFRENPWSGFWDQFVTHARTDRCTNKGNIIEPVASLVQYIFWPILGLIRVFLGPKMDIFSWFWPHFALYNIVKGFWVISGSILNTPPCVYGHNF